MSRRFLAILLGCLLLSLSETQGWPGDFEDGQELFFQRKYQEALERFRGAERDAPDDPMVHYHIGLTLFKLDQYKEARRYFEKVLNNQPDYQLAHLYLARSCEKTGDLQCARERLIYLEQHDYPFQKGDKSLYDRLVGPRRSSSPPPPPIQAVIPPNVPGPSDGKRIALVIGNASYRTGPIRNPINDAEDVASYLSGMNFETHKGLDLDRRRMLERIATFAERLAQADVGLFYYAGHGMQLRGHNYLIPVDASINTEAEVEFEGVDVGRVLSRLEMGENKVGIVILDACRNNPFERSFRSANRGLAVVDAPTGVLIAYSTAPGSVAADGEGRNGIFTRHFLHNMNIPGLTIEQVLKQTRVGVMKETGNRQVPWESSSLTGNFYFLR